MEKLRILVMLLLLSISLCGRAESIPQPQITNALIYLDHFLGGGKTALVADVVTFKRDSLKFRVNGNDFDYSGHFSIFLFSPRKHKNPLFGFGSPETAKFITLEDFFKDQSDSNVILPNSTIWEKSDGYIDVVSMDKEWIHSGSYTITN